MTYIVIVTDSAGEESRLSLRRFPSRDAAEGWARRMIVHATWRVEQDDSTPSARGLDL